jgi:surface polysaccharide O-acyltransferase-like enzyme
VLGFFKANCLKSKIAYNIYMEINQEKDIANSGICQVCHQPILPTYYFCPNCGVKLISAPLSTDIITQIGIYLFSIILPSILFLFVSHWPGLKYLRSKDKKAKLIGWVAMTLLILSTLFLFYYTYVFTQAAMEQLNTSLNASLNILGY